MYLEARLIVLTIENSLIARVKMPDPKLPTTNAAPLVSIIMTTYNGQRFLASQLDSLLRQSQSDFELIVADDCSTDATVDLLNAHAAKDQRIRVFVNPSNLGVSGNLEHALGRARGEFIAISDQDDIWEDRKLEVLLQNIGNAAAIYSDSRLIDECARPLELTLVQRLGVRKPISGHQAIELLWKNCVSGHALLFRRQLLSSILPFDPCMMFDHQIAFIAAITDGLVYIDEPLVQHRIHGMNQTNSGLAAGGSRQRGGGLEARLEQFRGKRRRYAERLNYCAGKITHLARLHAGVNRHRLRNRVVAVAAGMDQFDDVWFDFRLFFRLLAYRNEFFYLGSGNALQYCMRYAKGAKYYRFSAASRQRMA